MVSDSWMLHLDKALLSVFNNFLNLYVDFVCLFLYNAGPDFGAPPSFIRKKFLTVLSECGKNASFIDEISTVKRYAAGSSHVLPVSSDDDALLKATKEVDV